MTYFLQLGEGDEYGDLAPVIFVGLLDFEVFPSANEEIGRASCRERV